MASVASPYGLRPVNLIGGLPFAGATRQYKVAASNTNAIFNGDLVQLSSAGLPSAVSSTPTAGTTAGIVGVMVGCRYINTLGQVIYQQYLPATTATATNDCWIYVVDDPNTLYQVQGTAALGTFNSGTNGSGWPGAIGKNTTLTFSTAGSTATGNSGVALTVGANGATLATTATLAVRIVDVVQGTTADSYPEFIVKLNVGVQSYTFATGV